MHPDSGEGFAVCPLPIWLTGNYGSRSTCGKSWCKNREVSFCKPRITWANRNRKKSKEQILPHSPQKEPSMSTPSSWPSSAQSWRTNFCQRSHPLCAVLVWQASKWQRLSGNAIKTGWNMERTAFKYLAMNSARFWFLREKQIQQTWGKKEVFLLGLT